MWELLCADRCFWKAVTLLWTGVSWSGCLYGSNIPFKATSFALTFHVFVFTKLWLNFHLFSQETYILLILLKHTNLTHSIRVHQHPPILLDCGVITHFYSFLQYSPRSIHTSSSTSCMHSSSVHSHLKYSWHCRLSVSKTSDLITFYLEKTKSYIPFCIHSSSHVFFTTWHLDIYILSTEGSGPHATLPLSKWMDLICSCIHHILMNFASLMLQMNSIDCSYHCQNMWYYIFF